MAFTTIILQMQSDLYKIAKSRLKNDEDSFDAIQNAIEFAYKNIKKLKDDNSFRNWIFKILINECYKIYNKNKKSNVIPIDSILNFKNLKYENNIENEVDYDFNKLLEPLNCKEKIIVTLYYKNRYTTKEISNILKIKENTVKSILRRSKSKIKTNYKEELYGF